MPSNRVFGAIPNVPVGATFESREQLSKLRVHRPLVGGICGGADGAESVVVSGGYEDDQDDGDVVTYTGHGGNAFQGGGVQVADQEWKRGNAGLARNWSHGWCVRLVRGASLRSPFAPTSGYRYDGLYRVQSYWEEKGLSGFRVCRFLLVRDDLTLPPWSSEQRSAAPPTPKRLVGTIQRIVRSTKIADRVKEIHNYACQICGTRLETPAGPYAEAAHIRGLGAPCTGPDVEDNILCLCPNHHVLFDSGALTINDDFTLGGRGGRLRVRAEHKIGITYLAYHRGRAAKT